MNQANSRAAVRVVEIMRHTTGKFADHLELLNLPQLFLGEGTLRALLDDFLIGLFKSRGAFPNAVLQCRVRIGRAIRRSWRSDNRAPGIILTHAHATPVAHAEQRSRVKRPLEKAYVAENLEKARRSGVALGDTSLLPVSRINGKSDHSGCFSVMKASSYRSKLRGLFRYDAEAGTGFKFMNERRNDRADFACDTGFREHRCCDCTSGPARCQYQRTLGELSDHSASPLSRIWHRSLVSAP